jgi:ribosome biogenesis SPOUT family RNA methylase Rps3
VDWFLLVGVGLGVASLIAYAIKDRSKAKLERGVPLFLSVVALPVGAHVIYLSATAHELKPFDTEERVYIALGGIALIWVSIQTILNLIAPAKTE